MLRVLCLLWALLPKDVADQVAEKLYDQGVTLYHAGDYAGARALFDEVEDIDPEGPYAEKASTMRRLCQVKLGASAKPRRLDEHALLDPYAGGSAAPPKGDKAPTLHDFPHVPELLDPYADRLLDPYPPPREDFPPVPELLDPYADRLLDPYPPPHLDFPKVPELIDPYPDDGPVDPYVNILSSPDREVIPTPPASKIHV